MNASHEYKQHMNIGIRGNGNRNAQVSDRAKELVFDWLEDRDVNTDEVLLAHYQEGDWVAVSWWGSVAVQTQQFNAAYSEAVSSYWRNRSVNDDCFWIHRQWIENLEGDG